MKIYYEHFESLTCLNVNILNLHPNTQRRVDLILNKFNIHYISIETKVETGMNREYKLN